MLVRSLRRTTLSAAAKPGVPRAVRLLATSASRRPVYSVPSQRAAPAMPGSTAKAAAAAAEWKRARAGDVAPPSTHPSPWSAQYETNSALVPVQPDGRRPFVPRPHLGAGATATAPPSYRTMYDRFRWPIPEYYNIGVDVCDKHVRAGYGHELALVYDDAASGTTRRYTWRDIQRLSNQLANALVARGLRRGDRVGILLPQCPEAAITHVAVYKAGAIAIPLFTLFGPEALEYRLSDSGAAAVVTDDSGLQNILRIDGIADPTRPALPHLKQILYVAEPGNEQYQAPADAAPLVKPKALPPHTTVSHVYDATRVESPHFEPVQTRSEDPALIIYTSGTTGNPKGCLHAHRVLLGHLPGVELPHNFFPQPQDVFWTPADWAWIGGLMDALMPSWHHRHPVLAHRSKKFDAHEAFALMRKHNVRNTFMPPTALKLMRQAIGDTQRVPLRSVGSGGETLGSEVLEWGRAAFGCDINEFFGQTECNLVVSNSATIFPIKPQSMGRTVPGHTVAVVDDAGNVLGPNTEGNIAIRYPDPTMFLRYWNNPKATRDKFVVTPDAHAGTAREQKWLVMGDQGWRDADGHWFFKGRDDDIICTASYRVGPGEIENSLLRHPAVAMSAVIGKPDATRTEIVKAFVVLRPGHEPTPALARAIQDYVKQSLAKHEYPREVEFVTSLPMTTTGKIQRKPLKALEIERAKARAAAEAGAAAAK